MNKKSLLKKKARKEIEDIIENTFEQKAKKYSPESDYSPFLDALIGKKERQTYSFYISVATTLGMSVNEQIAVVIANSYGRKAVKQYKIPYSITEETDNQISQLHRKIVKKEINADKIEHAKLIKSFAKPSSGNNIDEDKTVDLFIDFKDGTLAFIDITSPKPNIKEFKELKRKLLRWTGIGYANYKNAKNIEAILAMPYNPYYPQDYSRFSGNDFIDFKNHEARVQSDFWNWIAGEDIFDDLVSIFVEKGKPIQKLIKQKFIKS